MHLHRALVRPLGRAILTLVLTLSFLATYFIAAPSAAPVHALQNSVALTPPLGWNDWYSFGCNINDALIRSTADAMVSSGMQAAGYQYINLDDCWQVSRDASGTIQTDPIAFPQGIAALAAYVHGKGLKLGIYTDVGIKTCAGRPGSKGYEKQDALTYASWGIDLVKVDWCYDGGVDAQTIYGLWRDALAATGRPMVFSICNWGRNTVWRWGPTTGNMWRTTGDTADSWQNMLNTVDNNAQHNTIAGPGSWNDPDILHIGQGGMTVAEYQANFSLFALMAAPLIAGNDIRTMTQPIASILTNTEVLAIDQDVAGQQGFKIKDTSAGLQVWMRKLAAPGSRAVILFNRSATSASMSVNWADIGLTGSATARDLWTHTDVASSLTGYSATVPPHSAVMLKVNGAENSSWTQTPLVSGYLSSQIWTYADNGWGPVETNKSLGDINIRDGRAITLAGVVYSKGLGVHASSDVRYNLNGRCTKF